MKKYSFDHYFLYDEMTSVLKELEKDFPTLIKVNSICTTPDGHEVWAAEITNYATGDVLSKPASSKTYNKTDEFTEHLLSKKSAASADKIKDRADFPAAAKQKMASDRAAQNSSDEAKPEKQPTATPDSPVTDKTIESKKYSEGIDSSVSSTESAEPDISLVFKDDEDKKYDIDELLADIERRHHNNR